MKQKSLLLFSCCLAFASEASAATVRLDITSGYLFGASGIGEGDRLPNASLCVLVADLDGDGFDPIITNGSWVGGDDLLVRVSDKDEYPVGAFGFDLTADAYDAGVLSRSLVIDLAQFGARSNPVPVALRWFPTLAAATTDLLASSPAFGTPYGQLSRAVPRYSNTDAWVIDLTGGASFALDPLVTTDQGGSDSPLLAMASLTVVPEPSSIVAALSGMALLLLRRRRIHSDPCR